MTKKQLKSKLIELGSKFVVNDLNFCERCPFEYTNWEAYEIEYLDRILHSSPCEVRGEIYSCGNMATALALILNNNKAISYSQITRYIRCSAINKELMIKFCQEFEAQLPLE